MKRLIERVFVATSVALFTFALTQGMPEASVAVGIALTAFALLAVMRSATGVTRRPEVLVGGRSRAHREPLSEFAAPRHPSTPGRRRSRAPAEVLAAA